MRKIKGVRVENKRGRPSFRFSGLLTACGIIKEINAGDIRLEGIEIARRAVEIASEKQALNIILLDVRDLCSFADYFVICTGESQRQVRTILDDIELSLKREGVPAHHREGAVDSGWLLLDYGDVIVHIFSPEEREYYDLDGLWGEAKPVLRIQ